MNTPGSDALKFRKKTICAPIPMEDYATSFSRDPQPGTEMFYPITPPNDTYKYWNLGPSFLFGTPVSDFTFVKSNYSSYIQGLPYILE